MGCDHDEPIDRVVFSVSIHAPTWGATSDKFCSGITFAFQSTHPHGVRLILGSSKWKTWCFNPRTHMGCDKQIGQFSCIDSSFNPRTHMGCDVFPPLLPTIIHGFNPRTHMGCDIRVRIETFTL